MNTVLKYALFPSQARSVFQGTLLFSLAAVAMALPACALGTVQYDGANRTFRIDAAETTYVVGVNEHEQLQTLYWGARLGDKDALSKADAVSASGFEQSTSVTPQEFVGWGGGLVVEPDLKITFPDGNRDLVLHYVSYKIDGDTLEILMKDV